MGYIIFGIAYVVLGVIAAVRPHAGPT